jgi:hypothetical protein
MCVALVYAARLRSRARLATHPRGSPAHHRPRARPPQLARIAVRSGKPPASNDRPSHADASRPAARVITLGRWSFGGAGTIEVEEGELTPGILITGPEGACLEASLAVAETVAGTRQPRHWFPELRDVSVTDDQGSTSTLGPGSGHAGPRPGSAQRRRSRSLARLTRNFGGSRGRPGYEEVKLTLRPRLDPGAALLTLTFASETQQVTAEIPLTP